MTQISRCCGFRLQTGGLIIASLETIGGLIGTLICSVLLVILTQQKEFVTEIVMPRGNEGFLALEEALNLYITTFVVVFLIISIFQMVISFLLILAIHKKSSALLTCWMVFKMIFIIFVVFLLFLSITQSCSFRLIVFYLTVIGLTAFYLDVIYSLQFQIKLQRNGLPSHIDTQTESESDGLPTYDDVQKSSSQDILLYI